jgi:signal recognition particle subunit SRP54
LRFWKPNVNYKVVKEFIDRAKARSIGVEVMESLTPAQQVVKIVHEELIELFGKPAPLNTSGQPPHVVMLVGLQGAGKTTMAAKLALRLKRMGNARCWLRPTSIALLPSNSWNCLGAD